MSRQPASSLFLCGMMGSGKTTVGKILANKLELPFVDLDNEIEKEAGMSIPEIFQVYGEPTFRELEKKAVFGAAGKSKSIIALGGGTLQNQEIVDHLKKNNLLIFLDAPLSVLSKRLRNDTGRPLLQRKSEKETETRIARLLKERIKYYSQSHIKIEVEKYSPEMIADEIIKKLLPYEI